MYHPENNSFENFSSDKNNSSTIIHNNIRVVFIHPNGKLWLGTQEGLSIFDPATKTAVSYQNNADDKNSLSHNSIYNIFQDKNGSIWLGTYFGGVNVVHAYATPFISFKCTNDVKGLSGKVVSPMVVDRKGNL